MARLGQRVNAGEALAQAGEPQMQAGNYIYTKGDAIILERPDALAAVGDFRIIYRGQALMREGADKLSGLAQIMPSTLDILPPGAIPLAGARDVWVYQTTDDGNVYPLDGDLYRTDGLETAAYLTLYGGNPDDDGMNGNRHAWWGNDSLEDPAQRMTSRFQNLVEGVPLTSGNLLRLEDAAAQDFAWLSDLGYTVKMSMRITGRDRYELTVGIDDEEFIFTN